MSILSCSRRQLLLEFNEDENQEERLNWDAKEGDHNWSQLESFEDEIKEKDYTELIHMVIIIGVN